jgi:hypothetical protein
VVVGVSQSTPSNYRTSSAMTLSNDGNTNQEHAASFAPFDVEEVLLQLTIDEKVSLLSGRSSVKLQVRRL